jgi:hypothetical protein
MRHVPSLLTMQAPTGESGTHSRPNSGQASGVARPDMIAPQTHREASAEGARSRIAATSMAK